MKLVDDKRATLGLFWPTVAAGTLGPIDHPFTGSRLAWTVLMERDSSDSVRYYVYALSEPDTKAIRYVGVTKCTKARLYKHINSPTSGKLGDWVGELKAKGLVPSLSIIREVTGKLNGLAAESEEINRLSATCDLLNYAGIDGATKYRHQPLTFAGRTQSLGVWAKEIGITYLALQARLTALPVEVALSLGRRRDRKKIPLSELKRVARIDAIRRKIS